MQLSHFIKKPVQVSTSFQAVFYYRNNRPIKQQLLKAKKNPKSILRRQNINMVGRLSKVFKRDSLDFLICI